MAKKPGFMVYNETLTVLRKLDNEQRGILILAMGDYHEYGAIPDFNGNVVLDICWSLIQQALDRDSEAYQNVCQERSKSAKKRWAKEKGQEEQQTHTNASDAMQKMQMHTNASDAMQSMPTTTTTTTTTSTPTSTTTSTPTSTEQHLEQEHERIVKGNNSGYTSPVCSSPDRNVFDRYVIKKGFSSYVASKMWHNLFSDGLLDAEWKTHVDEYIARMNSEGADGNAG